MAWRNINVHIGTMGQSQVNDFTFINSPSANSNKVTASGFVKAPSGVTRYTYCLGSSTGYGLYCDSSGNSNYTRVKLMINNTYDGSHSQDIGYTAATDQYQSYIACVNDETGDGYFTFIYKYPNQSNWSFVSGAQNWRGTNVYNLLKQNEFIIHSWRCLDAINGEFGSIELAKIKEEALNNGNRVTSAPKSNFSSLPESSTLTQLCGDPSKVYALETNGVEPTDDAYEVLRSLTGSVSGVAGYGILTISDKTVTPNFSKAQTGLMRAYAAILVDDDNSMAKWSLIHTESAGGSTYEYNAEEFTNDEMKSIYTWLFGEYTPNQDNEPTDEPGEWTPRVDEPINAPTTPGTSAIDTGFTTMYKIDPTELKDLSEFLWSDNFIDVVNKFFDDPSQAIVGLMMFPVSPNVGNSETIKPAGVATPASGYPLTSQYRDILIGTKYIKPAGNSFLDYTPYTKVLVNLPYCGEHALDVNDIMGKTLELHYIFDFLTGAVIAYILVDGSMHYTFSGQCGVPIPISQRSYDSIISGTISAGAAYGGLLATMATGGLTSAAPLTALTASALNQMNIHPDIQYNSGGGGTTGFISTQTPFLRFEEPIPKLGSGQNSFVGRPTYMKRKISEISGYTKFLSVHLDNVICTEKEKADIENYLLNGFIKRDFTTLPTLTPSTTGNSVIGFFKNKSDRNVLGKNIDVTSGHYTQVDGKIIYNWSVLTPKIIVKGDFKEYNYVSIPLLNRLYFIDDIVLLENGMQEITLSIDSLESYRDQIKEASGVIERQKSLTNKYFGDSYYWTQSNKRITTEKFEGANSLFDRSYNCYVLTIAGNVTSP